MKGVIELCIIIESVIEIISTNIIIAIIIDKILTSEQDKPEKTIGAPCCRHEKCIYVGKVEKCLGTCWVSTRNR